MQTNPPHPTPPDPFAYIESTIKTAITQFSTQITTDLSSLYTEIKKINEKHSSLSSQLIEHKIRLEKVDTLSSSLSQATEQLSTINIRISNINKSLSSMQIKYDKIFLDNLTVPGYIGEFSQYKTMRDYIEDNITQMTKLQKDKGKSESELKAYRDKIEQLTNQCTQAMTNFTKTYMSFNNTIKSECNSYVDNKYEHLVDMINNLKIANGSEGLKIRQKADELKKEISDLKELREMIKMNVINEVNKCVKKVDMVGIDVEECKGDIRELKGKIGGMKNGNNSPGRRITVNSMSPRGDKDNKKRENSPIVRGRGYYQRSVEYEKPIGSNNNKGLVGGGNGGNNTKNNNNTISKDDFSDSFGVMKSKGISIIKEEDKILNISNIKSIINETKDDNCDKDIINLQSNTTIINSNNNNQPQQQLPSNKATTQLVALTEHHKSQSLQSNPIQHQKYQITTSHKDKDKTIITIPSLPITMHDKCTSTSSHYFSPLNTLNVKETQPYTKQKITEYTSSKHKIINLQFTGTEANSTVNPSFYDYSNNNTLNTTRPFSSRTHRKRQSFKEFIESNINMNMNNKHHIYKQNHLNGMKTQIDCLYNNNSKSNHTKVKSNKGRNKNVTTITTYASVPRGNH